MCGLAQFPVALAPSVAYSRSAMPSLVDRFCPNTHDAPITAAAFDPDSGTIVTADANGRVAVQRSGEASPRLIFQPGGAVNGALAVVRGGSLIAVGDESGTIGVYRTQDGESVFKEEREGPRGAVRAMRGVSINPEGSKLAAIAADGLLRVWDLTLRERNAWRGFSGDTVEFSARGERLLAMDDTGQPRLMDLTTLEALYMDKLQTPATKARFTACGTMVIAGGSGGFSLLGVADGALIASFATRGGSGLQNILLSPDGTQAAAITQRSVHIFSLPDLTPQDSIKHGAPEPSGAGVWHSGGVRVAGSDGLMHGGGSGSLGPVSQVDGIGPHRVLMHHDVASVWRGEERSGLFKMAGVPHSLTVDREGRIIAALMTNGSLQVYDAQTGSPLFDGGGKIPSAADVSVGGEVVALQLETGGLRWWHLRTNRGFSLPWPKTHTLSGSGTWLGVVTPKGAVRILDPSTGEDAIAAPSPLSDSPIQLIDFVNRSPELLVLDSEGVLGHYDLTASVQSGRPATGRDILTIHVPVDKIWGITGGNLVAMRLPSEQLCTILWVDLSRGEVVGEVQGLPASAEVDDEHGRILIPSRAGAMLELSQTGEELRVLRDLPDNEWLSFGPNGILGASKGATGAI